MAFNTAVIRELLSSGFNDEELRTLSYDHFRPVYEEFATGMTEGAMIQLLLDYAGRRNEMPSLLDRVVSNCGLRRDPHMVVLKAVVQTGMRPPKTCHDTAKQRRQATRRSQGCTNRCRTG